MPPISSTAANLYELYATWFRNEVDTALPNPNQRELAVCMRADAARFAAHKAVYMENTINGIMADESMTEQQRQITAGKAMAMFNRGADTEAGYIAHNSVMAGRWQQFEAESEKYLLQYRTAGDEKVRSEHAILHNITLPADDPFWNEYYPPLGWNCRCTVVQVLRKSNTESDSSTAIEAGKQATRNTPSFRFNPGKQKKLFPDNVSYLKHAGNNRAERDKTERTCEKLSQKKVVKTAKQVLIEKTSECTINDEKHTVVFIANGIEHYAQDMLGEKTLYWIKNELLPNIDYYIKSAKCMGRKISDTTHNTKKKTIRLKENTDYFYYLKIELPNGKESYLHLGRYKEGTKDEGKLYLYTISQKLPKNIEAP